MPYDNNITLWSVLAVGLLLISGMNAFVTANHQMSEEEEASLEKGELKEPSEKEDDENSRSVKDKKPLIQKNKQLSSESSSYREESIQDRFMTSREKEEYLKQEELDTSGKLDPKSANPRSLDLRKDELEKLQIERYDKGERGQYILTMKGPTQQGWLDRLQKNEVKIVNYMDDMEYRVRTLSSNIDEVEKLSFVEGVRIYQPTQKIDKDIELGKVIVTFASSTTPSSKRAIPDQYSNYSSSSIVVEVGSKKDLFSLARDNDILSIEKKYTPHLHDETSSEIVGGYWAPNAPYDGPGNYANKLGYNGSNVIVSIADTGIGDGSTGDAGHQDFTGRVVGGVDYSSGRDWRDWHAHGTHTAGLVAGDTYHGRGTTYSNTSYLVGQGVAPEALLFSQRVFDEYGFTSPNFDLLFEDAENNEVYVHSNSWGGSSGGDYTSYDRIYDTKVRDADLYQGGDQQMVITASAGNTGPTSQTIGSPGNAKNTITVGASENYHPDTDQYGNNFITGAEADNPEEIAEFSSRGPTEDNRIKPDVVAPGRGVLSTRSPNGNTTLYGTYTEDPNYLWSSGTSMSNPVIAGAASVVIDWYETTYGVRPSPAMVKSLLVNTAKDLADPNGTTGPIPNYDEGWGRAYLPSIVDPPVNTMVEDQENLLESGDKVSYPLQYDDPDHPLNISLVWTDPPSDPSNDVHLMNDLEVSVVDPNGKTWHGNAFQNGMSVAETSSRWDYDGDKTDDRNNVVNIFIPEEKLVEGLYTVVVEAENVAIDSVSKTEAVDQDYALTVYNGEEPQGKTPSISVYRPAYGDRFASNSVEPIKWVSGGGDGSLTVDLDYSVDDGASWNSISSGLSDTGIYNWTVAHENSTECRIRATVTDSDMNSDTSISGKFEITPVSIDVLRPSGGEVWNGNTDETIIWNTTGGVDPKTVNLWYSLNNRSTWNSISSGLSDDGSYDWATPKKGSNNALIRAQVVDNASDSYVDISDDTFRILSQKNPPWFDDMESGLDSWYPEDKSKTVWELGKPSGGGGPSEAYSLYNCWGTDLDSFYDNDANTSLITPPVNLSEGPNQLEFQTWYDTQSIRDAGWVEIGVNDTWTKIYPSEGPSYESTTSVGYGYSGNSEGWRKVKFNLTSYSGQTIQARFKFVSDGSITYPGWYIDDVYMGSPPPYRCDLKPRYQKGTGNPGTTVDHELTVNNTGTEDDTYDLTATDNMWSVDFFDMSNNSISSISVPAGEISQFIARVSVPDGADPGETDLYNITATSQGNTSIGDTGQIRTGVPFTTPWLDDFEWGTFGGSTGYNWTTSDPTIAGVNNLTSQSGKYSMYTSKGSGTVDSWTVNTNGLTSGEFRYWIRRGDDSFSENPDIDEDLEIYYKNETGKWVFIESFAGNGTPGEIYDRFYDLPSDAVHSDFQLRFVQTGGSGSEMDYWHIDDVYVGRKPSYRFKLTPDYEVNYSDPGTTIDHVLTVNNTGTKNDTYDLSAANNTWFVNYFDMSNNSINNIFVPAEESSRFIARVSIPEGVDPGDYDLANITATSQNNATVIDTARVKTEVLAPILLVDDDDGLNTEDWYIDALNANGYDYNYWNHSKQGTMSSKLLQKFNISIWFTGNSYGYYSESLDSSDRDVLGTYLDTGGRLYLSSSLAGYNAKNDGWSDWYNHYLHSSFEDVHFDMPIYMRGIPGDPISDDLDLTLYSGDYNPYLWPYTTMVSPVNQGNVSYFNTTYSFNSTIRANTGVYKTVHTTFDFAGVKGQENRATLMHRIIEWLDNVPPNSPTNPSPADGATRVSTDPILSVDVSDQNGHPMTVTFYDASDDSQIGQISNVASGSTTSVTWSGLTEGTTYNWYVVADDGELTNRSSTWSFTTNNHPDAPTLWSPSDGAAGVSTSPTLSVNVSDTDGDTMDVYFYNGTGSLQGGVTNVPSGGTANYTRSGLSRGATYDWYAVADDGVETVRSETWTFTTTTANNAPSAPYDPSPSDGAAGVSINPTLSVNVSDADGETMNVTFFNASDNSVIGSNIGVPNGTTSVTWSGLIDGRTYRWYATADDGSANVTSDTWRLTTRVSSGNDPPSAPYDPEPEDGETGVNLTPTLSVNVSDPDGDDMNVTFYSSIGEEIGTRTGVSNGTCSVTWDGLKYETSYSWYAVANDSKNESTSSTWSFQTMDDIYLPVVVSNSPTGPDVNISADFIVDFNETMKITSVNENFTYTDGSTTWDQTNGSITWTDSNKRMIFSPNSYLPENTTLTVNLSGEDLNGNQLDGNKGDHHEWDFTTEDLNKAPGTPFHPEPKDGAEGVSVSATLKVNVTDPDGDAMDVTFYDASDDSVIGTDTKVSSGDTASVTWSGLFSGTVYDWYAVANDSLNQTKSATWSFTTNSAPDAPTAPSPSNGTTEVSASPTLSVDVSDPDGDILAVYFYNASDGSIIGADAGVANDSIASITWDNLNGRTQYSWYAATNDGNLQNQSTTWAFTTDDFSSPTIRYTVPADDGQNVTVNSSITVEFSEPMEEQSVERNFIISPAVNGNFSWSTDNTTLTYQLDEDMESNTTYTVTIGTEASDQNGLTMESEYSFSFTTEDIIPSVEIREPSVGEQYEFGKSTTISWVATDDNPLPNNSVTIEVSYTRGVYWTTLSSSTEANGTYQWIPEQTSDNVKVRITCEDRIGQTTTKITGMFSVIDTIAPVVKNTTPAQNGTGVDIDQNITIEFNESIDTDSIEVIVTDDDGQEVSGSWTLLEANKTLIFVPDETLEHGTEYSVSVSFEDKRGNSDQHEFSFTTSKKGDSGGFADKIADYWWIIALLIAVTILGMVAYAVKHRGPEEEDVEYMPPGEGPEPGTEVPEQGSEESGFAEESEFSEEEFGEEETGEEELFEEEFDEEEGEVTEEDPETTEEGSEGKETF